MFVQKLIVIAIGIFILINISRSLTKKRNRKHHEKQINNWDWDRFKKVILAYRKSNLTFLGPHPFVILDKYIVTGKRGGYSHFLLVQSVDGKYTEEILVNLKEFEKYQIYREEQKTEPYLFTVFQHKKTNEYYVNIKKDETKAKKHLQTQALIFLSIFIAVLSLILYSILYFFFIFSSTKFHLNVGFLLTQSLF